MSEVRFIAPRPRLAALIKEPGGMTVGKALDLVETRLEAVRDETRAAMDEAIAALEAEVAAPSADLSGWLGRIEGHSAQVLSVAGPLGMMDLGRAAESLCDIAERFAAAGAADLPSLQVHARAIRLLFREPPLDEAARAEVLRGLELVLGRQPRA